MMIILYYNSARAIDGVAWRRGYRAVVGRRMAGSWHNKGVEAYNFVTIEV